MRVTSSMYYNNIFGTNHSKISKELFDVNKQISSGLKIQYASDDVGIFTETMRLDNEMTTLGQIKKSVSSGYKFSNQTDVILNEFTEELDRIKVLIINAANDTHDDISRDAISSELRAIEGTLKGLANTSINGKYLFSGSATDVKPISDDGSYNGNNGVLNALLGSNNYQQYNISGEDVFLGEEKQVRRTVTSNVEQSLNAPIKDNSIDKSSTMVEFMGDSPSDQHFFYLRGVQSDGTAFNQRIQMTDTETIDDLLGRIENAYGNTVANKVVNASLNETGQITIEDKIQGSSKLDFHMVGATDFSNTGLANVTNIDDLDSGSTDYAAASTGSSLYVREFVKSGLTQADSVSIAGNNLEGVLYDRTKFSVSGNTLSSNISQIDKNTNAFAIPSTKILDVASGTTLNGKQFQLSGTNISGATFDVQINFADAGSTFSIGGNTYDIFDVGTPRAAVSGDKMTYQQLMDVMNMVTTGSLPANHNGLGNDAQEALDYDAAIKTANLAGLTSISNDGKIRFGDLNFVTTKASMSLHDSNSGDFTQPVSVASVMSFNSNNSLTIRDPKTDFFNSINHIIQSVEEYKVAPNTSGGDPRNIGINNALSMMDDLYDHMLKIHSTTGAQSNRLNTTLENTEVLEVSTLTLRSEVVNTDLAESALKLQQLTLNYEAMLSTIGKVSQLSLVNYL